MPRRRRRSDADQALQPHDVPTNIRAGPEGVDIIGGPRYRPVAYGVGGVWCAIAVALAIAGGVIDYPAMYVSGIALLVPLLVAVVMLRDRSVEFDWLSLEMRIVSTHMFFPCCAPDHSTILIDDIGRVSMRPLHRQMGRRGPRSYRIVVHVSSGDRGTITLQDANAGDEEDEHERWRTYIKAFRRSGRRRGRQGGDAQPPGADGAHAAQANTVQRNVTEWVAETRAAAYRDVERGDDEVSLDGLDPEEAAAPAPRTTRSPPAMSAPQTAPASARVATTPENARCKTPQDLGATLTAPADTVSAHSQGDAVGITGIEVAVDDWEPQSPAADAAEPDLAEHSAASSEHDGCAVVDCDGDAAAAVADADDAMAVSDGVHGALASELDSRTTDSARRVDVEAESSGDTPQ